MNGVMRKEPQRTARGKSRLAGLSIAALSFVVIGVTSPAAATEDRPQGSAATPTPSPTPTPRPALARVDPLPCVGDCDDDDMVSVAELILGVSMALGEHDLDSCPAFDFLPDDRVMIDELLLSVAAANEGCGPAATPTPNDATLAEIQATIFTPRCAVVSCHSGAFPSNGISLEAGRSYDALVGKEPQNIEAASRGLLLVDPGDPDNSFLVVKVEGPGSPTLGSRMPLFPPNLTPTQIQLIRDWIAAGANP
jgi:hypothetical protein